MTNAPRIVGYYAPIFGSSDYYCIDCATLTTTGLGESSPFFSGRFNPVYAGEADGNLCCMCLGPLTGLGGYEVDW